MNIKKNKFVIFYIFNIVLLILILLLAIPASKYIRKINLEDTEFVKNQSVINPSAKSTKIINRTMQIKMLTEIDTSLNWEFKSLNNIITINVGENKIVKFEGKNLSNRTITSTAFFIAEPEVIYPYLIKTECFCFEEQTLKPGESQIFTMVFFLDPSLDKDKELDNIKDLVFTYKFSEYKS